MYYRWLLFFALSAESKEGAKVRQLRMSELAIPSRVRCELLASCCSPAAYIRHSCDPQPLKVCVPWSRTHGCGAIQWFAHILHLGHLLVHLLFSKDFARDASCSQVVTFLQHPWLAAGITFVTESLQGKASWPPDPLTLITSAMCSCMRPVISTSLSPIVAIIAILSCSATSRE